MESYTELVDAQASETEIRRYLVEGDRVCAAADGPVVNSRRVIDRLKSEVKKK